MTNNYSYNNFKLSAGVNYNYNLKEGYQEIGIKHISYDKTIAVNQITMAQNHHFKLSIEGLMVDHNMKHVEYGNFLPVEDISISPVTLESVRLNIGVFADIPILSKRRMGSLKVTLLDDVDNVYEKAVIDWYSSCCGRNGFVLPFSEVLKEVNYYEYKNDGTLSKQYRFWIIPEADVSSNRNYNDNTLKKVSFGGLIVGDVIEVRSGKNNSYTKRTVQIPEGTNTNEMGSLIEYGIQQREAFTKEARKQGVGDLQKYSDRQRENLKNDANIKKGLPSNKIKTTGLPTNGLRPNNGLPSNGIKSPYDNK